MPLNGSSTLTEGARMNKLMSCGPAFIPRKGNPENCISCVRTGVNVPITQTESSRIILLDATLNGTLINGGGVTQTRARELLAANKSLGSEGVRIALLQQQTIEAAADPMFIEPPNVTRCLPPLAPPPGPPARVSCALNKNNRR